MLVNLDQLIEAAGEITPHNPLYQITIRAFKTRNREIGQRQTRLFEIVKNCSVRAMKNY